MPTLKKMQKHFTLIHLKLKHLNHNDPPSIQRAVQRHTLFKTHECNTHSSICKALQDERLC